MSMATLLTADSFETVPVRQPTKKMSKRGGVGGGGRKSKVSCAKPVDPPFIQKIKEKIGWKAEPTIDSKVGQLYPLL